MDEIEQRLKETTDACIKSYEAWRGDQKNEDAREDMAEAIHELRKVASRLEIEIAVSEREQMSNRPIAIPPHRSSRKGQSDEGFGGDDDSMGNMMDSPEDNFGNNANANAGSQQQRRPNNNMRRPNNNMNRGRRPGGGGGGPRPNQGGGNNE